jgi:3-hydroxyacyl-CoA dehydrogenase
MPSMPLDFAAYLFVGIFGAGLAGAAVGALIALAVRKVRCHNAEIRVKQLLAQARKGYVVIDEEDALTGDDVTAVLDAVFGPGYDDRDRWQS